MFFISFQTFSILFLILTIICAIALCMIGISLYRMKQIAEALLRKNRRVERVQLTPLMEVTTANRKIESG